MNLRGRPLLTLLFLVLCSPLAAAAGTSSASEVADHLRRYSTARTVGDEPLRAGRELALFYRQQGYQPAWSDGVQLLSNAEELLNALPAAADEGLEPQRYHLPDLSDRREQFRIAPTPIRAAELDLLLTDAFLLLSHDYLNGRVDPTTLDHDWHLRGAKGDPVRMLQQALASGRIRDSLHALLPTDPAYRALRNAYQTYRQLDADGGWPLLPHQTPLRLGDQGPVVTALRQRLLLSNDLSSTDGVDVGFDLELEAAVRRFQARHGLVVDGVVGAQTRVALNLPASARVAQLALNLERWRWLPRRFGSRYLLVNLPAFELNLIEEGQPRLAMRVIVGRPRRHTPVFSADLESLVLNPYWEVPRLIAAKDLLPKIQRKTDYLREYGFRVFTVEEDGEELDPASIDWQTIDAAAFPYHLRQNPGPQNALGRFKFILPNPYTVYLHDTPTRELFEREHRSFSSGCIRIEQPLELAERLLAGTGLGDRSALETALEQGNNQMIPLAQPIPVFLLYLTAAVDEQGILHFYPDLYRRDPKLAVALRHNR